MAECAHHLNPADWREEPCPGRGLGYRVTHCIKCGKWLGYRLPDGKQADEQEHAARLGQYVRKQ